MEPKFEKWGVQYGLDGKRWSLDVMAVDADDAMRRVKRAAAFGTVIGRQVISVKIAPDWVLPLWRRLRRRLRGESV